MRGMRIRVIDVLDLFAAELNPEQVFDDGSTFIIDGARLKSPNRGTVTTTLSLRTTCVIKDSIRISPADETMTGLWFPIGSAAPRALQLLFDLIRQFQPTAAPSNSLSASCSPQPFHISGDWQLRRNKVGLL